MSRELFDAKSKLLILLFLFSLIPFLLIAQTPRGSIEGTILTDRGNSLVGANVILEGTTIGAVSDITGKFQINRVPVGTYIMIVSHIGYQSVKQEVIINENETVHYDIEITRSQYMPQFEIIGYRPGNFERIPGSAGIINRESIAAIAPVSGHEVFRKVSGVHAVEEEGVGLRANIGIRGLDPNKSRTVLMLEDGIPVALAPYGEPEMYYTPAMDRMEGLEIIKGSGSILFGPQTFGGVVNYLTANPPAEQEASIHLRGGEGGFFVGRVNYGNTIQNTGLNVNYLHKQGDEVGLLNFGLHDVNAKLQFIPNKRSVLGVKLGFYDETSNSTYVGLSQAMYDAGRFDFTHLAPDDVLDIRRFSASATHDFYFNDDIILKTTAFGYTTTRNWSRQEFDNTPQSNRNYIRIVGDPNVENGAIFFRDATGNRNRSFEVFGLEPRLSVNYNAFNLKNELDAGVRYLFERAYEQRINGTMDDPTGGILRDDEIRTGHAFSAYFQNRIYANENLSLTPGLRLESFVYSRDIQLLNYQDHDVYTQDALVELIPGIGLNYQYGEGSYIYGGVHRGFGPPRVKDAISAEGQSEQLDAEKSWNYELGTRTRLMDGLNFELTGFYLDFSNQVIPVAESAGGIGLPGTTSLVNGGSTRHSGIETGLLLDISKLFNTTYNINLNSTATYIHATFSNDRFIESGNAIVNVKGNRLPYAPEYLYTSNLYVATPFGAHISLTGTYTGNQFTDALNTIEGSADGRTGKMSAHFIADAQAGYSIPGLPGASVSLSVKNLFNERYISSRRPQGIRVGLPRFISAGFDFTF